MDELDFMCEIAVRAMEQSGIEAYDARGAREAGYDALMDFDVDADRKRLPVDKAVGEYFVDMF